MVFRACQAVPRFADRSPTHSAFTGQPGSPLRTVRMPRGLGPLGARPCFGGLGGAPFAATWLRLAPHVRGSAASYQTRGIRQREGGECEGDHKDAGAEVDFRAKQKEEATERQRGE